MIRRFNYTGRKKIPRSRVRIRIAGDGEDLSFDAVVDLEGMGLPREASVFVEAYYRSFYRRFDFGTVGNRRVPGDRRLEGFPVRKPLFRVKVVLVEKDGPARILAAADKVVPEESEKEEEPRQSLLPVDYEDLGDRIWALDLDSDWPRLKLNKNVEGIREEARSGPEFAALVYPEVFRAVLEKALEEGCFDPEGEDEDWGTLWLRFACRGLGCSLPPEGGEGEWRDWLEDAVNAFCARVKALGRFKEMMDPQGK